MQFASFLGVPFTDLQVDADIAWDNRRKFGVGDLDQAALGFVFRVSITSSEPEERILDVFRRAEDGCYASDAIRNEVPVRAHLVLNGSEVHVQETGGQVPEVDKDPWYRREHD